MRGLCKNGYQLSHTSMDRRRFLQAGASALLGYGELAFLAGLKPVSAAQVRIDPGIVRFDAAIGHALLWDNDPYWT